MAPLPQSAERKRCSLRVRRRSDPVVEATVVANEYRGERGRHMPPPPPPPKNGQNSRRPINNFYDQSPFEKRSGAAMAQQTQQNGQRPNFVTDPTPGLAKGE